MLGMLERSVSEGTVPAAEHEARKERIEEASRKAAALRAQADEVVMDQSAVACTQVPANPPASPIDDLIKAAVEEVMAESS